MYINGSSLPNLPDGWKEVFKQMSAVTDGSKVQQPYSEAMDNAETDHVLPGNIFVLDGRIAPARCEGKLLWEEVQ